MGIEVWRTDLSSAGRAKVSFEEVRARREKECLAMSLEKARRRATGCFPSCLDIWQGSLETTRANPPASPRRRPNLKSSFLESVERRSSPARSPIRHGCKTKRITIPHDINEG